MRVTKEMARKNRATVVKTASRLFRKFGYDGIGIAGLMQASGLTNGAFYKQFKNKEALAGEATAVALQENADTWRKVLENTPDNQISAFRSWYLSEAHVQNPDRGCAYATLAVEAPRHMGPIQQAFDEGLENSIEILAQAMTPGNAGQARPEAIKTLSELVGALVLMRAIGDGGLKDEVLSALLECKVT